jgi:hypothetical protein
MQVLTVRSYWSRRHTYGVKNVHTCGINRDAHLWRKRRCVNMVYMDMQIYGVKGGAHLWRKRKCGNAYIWCIRICTFMAWKHRCAFMAYMEWTLCVYVCIYVRIYVYMNVCMYVFMYVCMYVCMYVGSNGVQIALVEQVCCICMYIGMQYMYV